MRWVLLGIAVLTAAAVLWLYLAARKNGDQSETIGDEAPKRDRVTRLLIPTAERLLSLREKWGEKLPFLRREGKRLHYVVSLHPGESREKTVRDYRLRKAVRVTAAVIIGGVFGFCLLSLGGAKPLGTVIARPERGDGDKTVLAELQIASENRRERKQAAKSLTVTVPEKEWTEDEKILALGAAAKTLCGYFEALNDEEGLEEIPPFPTLPEGITANYYSLSPELLADDGNLLHGWPTEKTKARFRVTLWAEELFTKTEVEYTLKALGELSIERQLELIRDSAAAGEFLTEDALVLPEKTPSGVKLDWSGQTTSISALGVFTLLAVLLLFTYFAKDIQAENQWKARQRELEAAFPGFLSELTVLLGAGLSVENAWVRLAQGMRPGAMKEELGLANSRRAGGYSTEEMLNGFADRLGFAAARRAASLIREDRIRGDARLTRSLTELTEELWEEKKKNARQKSTETEQKLLLPLILMLITVMLTVIAPAMMSLS